MKLSAIAGAGLSLATLVAGALGADYCLRQQLSSTPRIQPIAGDGLGRVFVLLPGAQVEAQYLYPQLIPVLQAYDGGGNGIVIADSGSTQFDLDKLIAVVRDATGGYDRVTFVGASMGFMVAWDIATYIRYIGDWQQIDILSLDGITGAHDLVMERFVSLGAKFHAGPICNALLTKLIWKAGFRPAPLDTIHPRDKKQLYILWQCYWNYPLSKYTDELRFISSHAPLTPIDVRVAVVQSMLDKDVVRHELALEHMERLAEVSVVCKVNSTHISLLDEPGLYELNILEALDSLG